MRLLNNSEIELLKILINKSNYKLNKDLSDFSVYELNDGGMGSIEFVIDKSNRLFNKAIVGAVILDIDDRKVMLELSIDNFGYLYQLDSFTEDFVPLKAPLGTSKKIISIQSPPKYY